MSHHARNKSGNHKHQRRTTASASRILLRKSLVLKFQLSGLPPSTDCPQSTARALSHRKALWIASVSSAASVLILYLQFWLVLFRTLWLKQSLLKGSFDVWEAINGCIEFFNFNFYCICCLLTKFLQLPVYRSQY